MTRQQYQLYVPPAYDASKAWPLVLIASPGDEPLGWRSWQKTCEDQGVIFCALYGVGNNVAAGRRVRILLDALDDVRRRYHVDPDRTYLVGFGGGGRPACAVAFALSEFFGGVIVADEGISLNGLEYLRWRVRDRLSVALIAPGKDHPWGRISTTWACAARCGRTQNRRRTGRRSAQLAEVYGWLAADVDRRRTEARRVRVWRRRTKRTRTCSRPVLAVDEAGAELARPDGAYRAATLLEGVDGACGPHPAGRSGWRTTRRNFAPIRAAQEVGGREGGEQDLALQRKLGWPSGGATCGVGDAGLGTCAGGGARRDGGGKESVGRGQTPHGRRGGDAVPGATVDGELMVQSVAADGPAALARG